MTGAGERRREAEARLGLRSRGTILSSVFFVLTCVAIAATYLLFERLDLPKGLWTALLCIGTAEILIRALRFNATGVESALWVGGLFAFILGIASEAKPKGLLLFALACAIAGARVRNPLIGSFTAVFVISYFGSRQWHTAALLAGIIIAALALAALARQWQRPSTEHLIVALMLIAPVAGSAWSITRTSMAWSLVYLALAAAEFAAGTRMRHRAALIAGVLSFAIAVIVLRELFAFAIEWKLIASGALLFAVSAAISRALRGRQIGFVATPVTSAYEEALRVFGSAAFSPGHEQSSTPASQSIGGGGSFGGAGSTGSF